MKKRFISLGLAFWLGLSCSGFGQSPIESAGATGNGRINGRVSNEATKVFLQDAIVELPALNKIARTNDLGVYTFLDIPAGEYVLVVNYSGLDEQRRSIVVVPNQSVAADFDLTSTVYQLDEFVISGEREGGAAAIMRQEAAESVRSVAAFGSLGGNPTETAADLLVRLPGIVGTSNDEGDVTDVIIRGFSGDRNVISTDGFRTSGGGVLSRGVGPSGFTGAIFDEIEVIKAFTPDLSAGSISGQINIKTASLLKEKQKRKIYYEAQVRWAPPIWDYVPMREANPIHPYFNVKYQELFDIFGGRRNFALMLNFNYRLNVNGADRVDQRYTSITDANLPVPDPETQYFYNLRNTYNERDEYTGIIKAEYALSKNNHIYFTTFITKALEKGQYQYNFMANSTNARTTGQFDMTTLSSTYQKITGGRVNATSTLWDFAKLNTKYEFGGNHVWGRLKLDYKAAYESNQQTLQNAGGGVFDMWKTGANYTLDKHYSTTHPTFSITNNADIFNPAVYSYTKNSHESGLGNSNNRMTYRDGVRDFHAWNAMFNLQYAPPIKWDAIIKTGAIYSSFGSYEDQGLSYWSFNGNISDYLTSDRVSFDNYIGGRLPFTDTVSMKNFWAKETNNGKDNRNATRAWYQSDANLYDQGRNSRAVKRGTKEDVMGAFLQGTVKIDKLTILGGLRFERTDARGWGYYRYTRLTEGDVADPYQRGQDEYTPRSFGSQYDSYFPSIHFTYQLNKSTKLRASWSTSMARPNLTNYTPSWGINDTDDFISASNPNVDPERSQNIDLEVSYMTKGSGLVTLGLFRKDLKDFIYTETSTIDGNTPDPSSPTINPRDPTFIGFPQNYWGYELRTDKNGGAAVIQGIEFEYRQGRFNFLPSFLRDFGGFFNITYQTTSGDYGDKNRSTTDVAGFAPFVTTLGLTYSHKAFWGSLTTTYTDDYLRTYASYKSDLQYIREYVSMNLSVGYRWRPEAQFYLNIKNLLNKPQRWYQYRREQERVYSLAGPVVEFGIRGNF